MVEEFNLVRVIYGKKDIPLNKREYRVREFDSSAVGSMEEIRDFLKDKGYSKFRLVLHDPISEDPPIHSIDYNLTKKKFQPTKIKGKGGWRAESARHALARKGIKTGKKKTKQWTLADEKKQISKLKDTHLLTQFENQDYIQFEYGQTSRWDALVYGLLENEIAKRGLEDKASEIVEKNKRKTERLGL